MARVILTILVLAACDAASTHTTPQFNWTVCPALHEVQLPHFANSGFGLNTSYPGLYYELAFHDILQATCPKVTCVHSNKAVEVYPDNKVYVNETWGLRCLGQSYPQILLNNATQDPGFFEAFVPVAKVPGIPAGLLKDLVFPNMVVDFKAGSAGWTVEFQCLALWGKIRYIGVNFYARNRTDAAYEDMLTAAKASGIDFFFDGGKTGFNWRRVDHSSCPLEPPPTPALVA